MIYSLMLRLRAKPRTYLGGEKSQKGPRDKAALWNAVSFSEHHVNVPAEHNYKAQFETSIDSGVE